MMELFYSSDVVPVLAIVLLFGAIAFAVEAWAAWLERRATARAKALCERRRPAADPLTWRRSGGNFHPEYVNTVPTAPAPLPQRRARP